MLWANTESETTMSGFGDMSGFDSAQGATVIFSFDEETQTFSITGIPALHGGDCDSRGLKISEPDKEVSEEWSRWGEILRDLRQRMIDEGKLILIDRGE